LSGTCQDGTPVDPSDGVDCTVDSCDEANDVIVHTENNEYCNDGFFCNGVEYCSAIDDCQAGTPVDTNDGLDCTTDSCDEENDEVVNIPIDEDADGFNICSGPDQDCDDGEPTTYPGAPEVCDAVDNDCSAITVDGSQETWYFVETTCGAENSPCSDNTGVYDCIGGVQEDTCDPYANAGPEESCEDESAYDGIDNDCNGATDLDCNEVCDVDGDGQIAQDLPLFQELYCVLQGFDLGDCNDVDNTIYTGALEIPCDTIDQDCDGTDFEGTDEDSDGYTLHIECTQIDCNDDDPSINPGATELCNGVDDDCDNLTDEGFDLDGDTIPECFDNCPTIPNTDQSDVDTDTLGDVCDNCPSDYNPGQEDVDLDGILYNPLLIWFGGDVCDQDNDNDGCTDAVEAIVGTSPLLWDTDGDSVVDNCGLDQVDCNTLECTQECPILRSCNGCGGGLQ